MSVDYSAGIAHGYIISNEKYKSLPEDFKDNFAHYFHCINAYKDGAYVFGVTLDSIDGSGDWSELSFSDMVYWSQDESIKEVMDFAKIYDIAGGSPSFFLYSQIY